MKTILKKIAIVCVAIIAFDRVAAYLFMHLIFDKTVSGESGGTINYAIERNPHLDFLVLGASRAEHQIDPAALTALGANSYNLGIDGDNVLASALILDILVRNGVRPKTLLLQTDLFEYTTGTTQDMIDQIDRLYPYDTPLIRSYVAKAGLAEEIKYFFDLYKLNRKMLDVGYNFLKRNSVGTTTGFVPLPPIAVPPQISTTHYAYDDSSVTAQAMPLIKNICDEYGIRLIVVLPPSYGNSLFDAGGEKHMTDAFRAEGITDIVDLADIAKTPTLASADNWRDAEHMDALGAETFSKILNEKLLLSGYGNGGGK
ncbi:MAG: hypothetical protein KGH93_03515 [Patescibacteria group bacterium]|nr:hypothetical protein [Patescibacteria group bacterium]MDE1946232.1 hypothetical protein [Patescibacteria group bacterium]